MTDRKLGEQIARKSGSIANVVLDAQNNDHFVQIRTTRGKIYIGWILLGPGISREGKVEDIAAAPLFSEHRDPTRQRMSLDVDYLLALFRLAELDREENGQTGSRIPKQAEMSVVVPTGEIALIRRFNEELDEFFFPMRNEA